MNELDELDDWLDGPDDGQPFLGDRQDAAELLRAVEDSLRRQFAPPETIELPFETATPARPSRWRELAAAALLIVIGGGVVWKLWTAPKAEVPDASQPARVVDTSPKSVPDGSRWTDGGYGSKAVDTGRRWVAAFQANAKDPSPLMGSCVSPGEVPDFLQPLTPVQQTDWVTSPSVQFVGSAPVAMIDDARVLQYRLRDGRAVWVFVLNLADDPRPELPDGSKLNLFRAEREGLVAYELTPEPRSLACARMNPSAWRVR